MSAIDYGSQSDFRAPVMRIDDEGHGLEGVVYDASVRQAVDYETGKPKWFRNRELVKSDEPRPGDAPVPEYVFHVAVKKGRGAFTQRDENGDAVKLSSGKNATEVRSMSEEDIAFVAGSACLARAVKSVKLNTGHHFRLKRLTPARDESGDRMTDVRCEIEILGTVDNPQPYKAETSASVEYAADDEF
jgi:hypothetical protein